jgi:uncharacterized protein (DUF2235 family)
MRRLVFCFDGSWNKLSASRRPTNVVLLAESVIPVTKTGVQQIVYYDEGVGTSSDDTFRGGAFGKGLNLNIREAYRFLIFNYQPGDELFVFGFSRGAFTARSFVGFLRCAGVLPQSEVVRLDEAWTLYSGRDKSADTEAEARRFRSQYSPSVIVTEAERQWRSQQPGADRDRISKAELLCVRYLGVWDTVGSLGWKVIASVFDRRPDKQYRQHDTDLSPLVRAARHAVSIDERRVFFAPTLWNNLDELNAEDREKNRDLGADEFYEPRYQQMWFPGDHSSIGGGGVDSKLSNAALQWVLRGAVKEGLKVHVSGESRVRRLEHDVHGLLCSYPATNFGERTKQWLLGKLLSTPRSGPNSLHEVSASALRRWLGVPPAPAGEKPYRPKPLRALAAEIEGSRARFTPRGDLSDLEDHELTDDDLLGELAADRLGDVEAYPVLFDLNRDKLDNPNELIPGTKIRLPRKRPSNA